MLRVIPIVVIPCLPFSLLESLNILPAHLSHIPRRVRRGPWRRLQSRFANGLKRFAQRVYCPVLDAALRWRYLTASVGVGVMIVTVGLVLSGRPGFRFVPALEADVISASMTMPQGSPVETTGEAVARLEAGAARLRQRLREETGQDHFVHVLAVVGDQPMAARGGGPITPVVGMASSHVGEVAIELAAPEQRRYRSEELGLLWRDATGPIPEAVAVDFTLSRWSGAGSDVDVQLAGADLGRLRAAADEVKRRLREYAGVYEVTDSFRAGKEEMKLGIKPAAETLGLTLQDLGRQVRQAFYGEEAQRIQRGRDDIRVMVRYPRDERRSLGDLENMRIRTPDGGEVPFGQVAVVEPRRGFASIRRIDRNRAVNVTASVDATVTSAGDVIGDLNARILPEVLARHPGVFYTFGDHGRAAGRRRRAAAGLRAGAADDLRAA
ncbi:MAG: efflux RND transporter permease subunit, partial [Acidobacteria bacterium]|nr:efflux RND transporter permease subunit [Acidobacteriota bacterium]